MTQYLIVIMTIKHILITNLKIDFVYLFKLFIYFIYQSENKIKNSNHMTLQFSLSLFLGFPSGLLTPKLLLDLLLRDPSSSKYI